MGEKELQKDDGDGQELKRAIIQQAIKAMLEQIGEDPSREGLQETPARYAKWILEFIKPEPFNFTTFEGEGYDQMIIQKNIPFYSLCEHHMLPFFGVATIGYLPKKRIVGLSKLARCLKHYSAALQNQERITRSVADRLAKELDPIGVGVIVKARHFCMEMRGAKVPEAYTTTSCLLGKFREDQVVRAEFLRLAREG